MHPKSSNQVLPVAVCALCLTSVVWAIPGHEPFSPAHRMPSVLLAQRIQNSDSEDEAKSRWSVPVSASTAPSLVREAVVFAHAQDPRQVVLADGREFEVRLDTLGGAIPEDWRAGEERLILDYDESRGAALVHTVTGERLPLVGWQEGRHPIEVLLRRDFQADETTLGMDKAYANGTRRWDREIARLYLELADHPAADDVARKRLRRAAEAWRSFQEKELLAYAALADTQSGTRWTVMNAAYAYEQAREQARRLLGLWGELRSPEHQTESPPVTSGTGKIKTGWIMRKGPRRGALPASNGGPLDSRNDGMDTKCEKSER